MADDRPPADRETRSSSAVAAVVVAIVAIIAIGAVVLFALGGTDGDSNGNGDTVVESPEVDVEVPDADINVDNGSQD